MNTFLLISLYSVMVLLGLSTLAASFVFLGKWMIRQLGRTGRRPLTGPATSGRSMCSS